MTIKKAGIHDIEIIQNLANIIWPQAYGSIVSQNQIDYMLALIYNKEALQKQMENGHQFLFVIENNIEIGFASYSQKSKEESSTFRLHKIYVLPNQLIKGIGSFLLAHICNDCKIQGATLIELNVNKYNTAKLFYEKKGFTILKEEVIDIGNGYVMDDYVMEKKL